MFTAVDPAEEQDDGLVGAVQRAGSAALDFLRRRPRANVIEANDVARRAHLGSIAPQLPDIPAAGTFEAPAASFEMLDREHRAAPATWGQVTASLPGRAGAALKKGFADFSAMNEAMRADNLRKSGLADVAEMYPQSPAGRATLDTLADARNAEAGAVEAEQWLNAARPVGKESFLQKAVGGAAESSLSNYLPMAAGIATGSVPAAMLFQALGMAPPVVGGTFREAKKLSPEISNDDALRAGVRALGAELVGEAAPVGVALRKGMGPVKRILATAGTEGLEEGVTSPLQSLNAKLSYNPNLTLDEAINDAVLSMASGAIAGGPMGAVGGVRTAYDASQQPAPTTAFRPTPETAEALARAAAPPQDRMQQTIEPAAPTPQAPTVRTDRAQFLYEPSQSLSDEERAIEQRFAQNLGADPDRAIANYEARNTQNGTLVINTDQARDLSEDYNRDIESRSLYAAAVHEPASALVKRVWRAALDRPPTQGKEANVIFTAGGTGAGKTTAIDNVPAIAQLRDASDIIYDGNLNNFDKAVQRIEEALASGRTADIVYVYRDPVEAMRNGALTRAERQGRTVRVDAHADSHIGSLKVVAQLMGRYKGDPRVNIVVLDNSHGPGGAIETTIDRLPAWEYDALAQELINVVQADYEAGRISDRVYRGTLGQRAAVTRGTESRLQEGDSGKPQPKRTRQSEETNEPVDRALGETASRGINVEVAPSPADTNRVSQFEALTPEQKAGVTREVGGKIVTRVIESLGFKPGSVEYSVGGYLGEINPTMIVHLAKSESYSGVVRAARALGYVLHQQAVIAYDEGQQGSGATGFVKLTPRERLSEGGIKEVFDLIRAEVKEAQGFTARDGSLVFGNFSDMGDAEFAAGIRRAMAKHGADFDVQVKRFRSDYLEAPYHADQKLETGKAGREVLRRQGSLDSLQAEADAAFAAAVENAGKQEVRADRAQGVEQRAFYGRDAIDSLEVGRNKEDHPAIDYRLPGSMGQRRNINPPDSTHQRMLNAAAHDIEAAGFPLAAAMQAVKGVVTYNGNYSNWHAAWLPDHRVVAFSEMRLIEMEGSDARQRYLRGWMAHELTHAIDDAGNGSISSGSPRLDFFVAGDTMVTKGDVVTEVAEAYTKGGKIGEFFEYPMAYAKQFSPTTMKEELLAQLSRLYTTNRQLMRRELPASFKMMEDWYAQIQPDSLAATRAGLQAALRAPGAGLGGQERQLHGVDQAIPRADRGVSGVGGAGTGVATGRAAAAGGQGAVTGAQPDLFQSAYSGEKYAVNLNLDRYDTAGAIKGLIEATAKNITDKSSRGETATHEKTLAEADRLGISEDQVLAEARKGGKPMSLPEARAYALAVRQLIVTRAEATKHFAETAFKSGDSQDRAEAMASLYHLAALQAVGMNLSAEAGRLLNSYRILAGVTTGDRMSDAVFDEERQKTAEQVLEQMFGGTNNVDDILARVALMSTQQLASPKMRKALLSRRPSAFLEIWKAGLLSGPQTHIVNMASNALTALIRAPETAVAAAIGKLHGGDKAYFREVGALMAGMTAGTIIGARDAWQIIRHGEDANDAGKSETTGKAITGENFGLTGKTGKAVDIAGEVVRTPFRALAAEDAIFKGVNRTGTLYALAYRQAIKEGAKNVSMRARELVATPTREMMKAALEDGLYFTFNNQLGAAGQKTLDILHSTKAGKLAQFAVVPFFRTPVNILKFGIHRSPLAPLTQKFQEDIKAGGAKRDMAIARMMTGTAIMTAAFSMAAAGLLTGGGEPDKERKAADRIAGWRPYSVRLGNKFFEYRRLEPLGMLLGMAADIYELSDYMTREESDHWIKMAGMAFAQNITSKTFLTGLTNMMKAMSEPEQYGDNYIGAMTGSFVPGVVGQAARARDPWERDTAPDKNLKGLAYAWDDVKRDIQARIPGQREKLPLRRDALGQPMPLTDSPSMFNPIRTGTLRTDDPVAMELASARARVSPSKGVIANVKLSPEEKEAYGQASGTVARARLERLFASPAYQGLPQFLRDEKISKEMGKARADVRDAIVKGMPVERRVEAKVRQLRR